MNILFLAFSALMLPISYATAKADTESMITIHHPRAYLSKFVPALCSRPWLTASVRFDQRISPDFLKKFLFCC